MQNQYPLLTAPQATYLTTLLPNGYSFQLTSLQAKRVRTAKKMDDSFTTEFVLPVRRKLAYNDKEYSAANHKQPEKDSNHYESKINSPLKYQTTTVPIKQQQEKISIKKHSEQMMRVFLLRLKMHKSSWPFRMPVDPVTQAAPNYYQVVKEPMDLKTIDRKIKSHLYQNEKEFDTDIRKIIANSYVFNSQDTAYYTLTKEFQSYYEDLWVEYKKNPEAFLGSTSEKKDNKDADDFQQKNTVKSEGSLKRKTDSKQTKPKAKRTEDTESEVRQITTKNQLPSKQRTINTLGFKQREKMFHKIQNLSQNGIKNLVKLLYGSTLRGDWEELQLDLAQLCEDKFRKLEAFLSQN